MYKHKKTITSSLFVFMLLYPLLAIPVPSTGETVTQRGTVDDDYYAAGGTVDLNAIINGDAVVAGGELFIGHHIKGDATVAGGNVHLRGNIQDDVRTAGGDISVDASIGDDLIASGGRINVTAASTIGGETWLAGGDVLVAGTLNRDLVVAAGSIRISGIVHGDVILQGGEIQILEGAVIDGNLDYKSPYEANIHSAAIISGDINYQQIEWQQPHRGTGIIFVLTMIVASIVLFKLFPGFTLSSVDRISADPLKNLGAGLLVLFITPLLAALLMAIVLGLWVGLSIMALYMIALITGFLVACFFVGDWGAKRFNTELSSSGRRLISVIIAIIALGLIKLVPLIGGLVVFVLLLAGLGAVVLQLRDNYKQSSNA